MFIDATVIKGQKTVKSCTIKKKSLTEFIPFDLTDYNLRFQVLGAPTADAKVLVEHIITQVSDPDVDGQITDAVNGKFEFVITAEDTETIGLGKKPIKIDFLDVDTNEFIDSLTFGGLNGEFNKIQVVQV